jgi:nickel superoxide dismutase
MTVVAGKRSEGDARLVGRAIQRSRRRKKKEGNMKAKLLILPVAVALASLQSGSLRAHCQIPCGIYDDPARFVAVLEHVTTIEKSMKQIEELSKAEKPNSNQLVRWVNNKEEHADKLTEIVTFYFMAQRVKPTGTENKVAREKYLREITLLHQMIVSAMKAKQTTDLQVCATLRELTGQFKESYLGKQAP